MDIEQLQDRARSLIARAADLLHRTAHPGDELGRSSADAPVLDPIVRKLNELEDLLGPGIGRANTEEGLSKLRDVVRETEGLVVTQAGQGGPIFMSQDARNALTEAARLLKQVDALYS